MSRMRRSSSGQRSDRSMLMLPRDSESRRGANNSSVRRAEPQFAHRHLLCSKHRFTDAHAAVSIGCPTA
jgi:hypothetical protein